jgi:hypothetical protein
VSKVNTFRSMPWRYRVVASSYILPLICVTLATLFGHSFGMFEDFRWVAGGMWLKCFLDISVFVRGYLAEKRGVKPADIELRDIRAEWQSPLIFIWLVIIALIGWRLAFGRSSPLFGWFYFALFVCFFFVDLSDYAYARFLNRSCSRPTLPGPDASSVESP